MEEYPKLRKIEILPITQGNEKKLFFRDSQNITDKTLTLPYKNILIVKYLDGNHDIRDIQAKIMRETGELLYSDDIKSLVELLDKCYFLDNQNFSKLKNQVEQDFKKQKIRKSILSGNSYPADGDSLRKGIDSFFTLPDSSEPIDKSIKRGDLAGMISPHIDFDRGGACYSHVLKELAERCSSRKFLILGTAHNSKDSFFTFTAKDFETPFGIAKVDEDKINWFCEKAGEGITQDELIHQSEHSIEFQVVLLQYLFGDDPSFEIIPVLCGRINETMMNGVEPIEIDKYRGIIEAMKEYVSSNKACVVAGADLSHIGPRFGDQQPVSMQLLGTVEEEDHKIFETLKEIDSRGFFSNIARQRNRWRVCGFSPILAQLYILDNCKGELINYSQAKDPIASVTFCAYSFYKN